MGQKSRRRRNRVKPPRPTPKKPNRFIKLRAYFKRHSLPLISLAVTIIASFVIFYFSYAEPDLRTVVGKGASAVEIFDQKLEENDDIIFYCRYKHPFKNFSFRSGYVDKVEFNPKGLSFAPEITLRAVDKVSIGWREEAEIEVLFLMTVRAADYYRLEEVKGIPVTVRFYDNRGNLIRNTDEGTPIEVQITLDLKLQRLRRMPDGSMTPVPPPK